MNEVFFEIYMIMKELTLSITWYLDPPIDFEHKQYLLLSYLQIVDNSFLHKKLSPHFLFLEKLLNEMSDFTQSFDTMVNRFNKERYYYFTDNKKIDGFDNKLIYEIKEIVEFSTPQITTRIDLGKVILKNHRQVLY